MCNIGAVGLGLQGVGLISQYNAAKKEQAAYAEYSTLSTQATLDNFIQQTRAINNRYIEETEATTAQKQEIYLQNLQAKATAQASAASSGIEGISLDELFRGYDRATAVSNYTAAKNLHWKGLQYNDELDGLRVQAINSINLQQQYSGASPSSTLLSGIGGLFTSYAREYKGKGNGFTFINRENNKRTYGTRINSIYTTGGMA